MEELEFVPNAVARGLASGKHWILGLIFMHAPIEGNVLAVEEASLLYTDIVIRGAESRAAKKGYSLLLCGVREFDDSGLSQLLSLTGTVDGMIVLDRVLTEEDATELGRRTPLVLLAGKGDTSSAMTIRVDNEQAMRSLTEHLVNVHQISKVGFVSGLDESPDSVARAISFKVAAMELGAVLLDVDNLKSDWTSGGGEAAMRARMSLNDPLPEVFACANDQTAVGVIFALKAAGIRVPEDIKVTGFDDITLTRYFNPPLTTIRQSGSLLGEVAVDALLATLDGNVEVQRNVVLPTELIVRGSCGCVVNPDPLPDLFEVVARHLEAD